MAELSQAITNKETISKESNVVFEKQIESLDESLTQSKEEIVRKFRLKMAIRKWREFVLAEKGH